MQGNRNWHEKISHSIYLRGKHLNRDFWETISKSQNHPNWGTDKGGADLRDRQICEFDQIQEIDVKNQVKYAM